MGGMARVFITQIASSSTKAMEKVNVTDHLLKLIRKFLDWLIKITYLQKFKTAIKSKNFLISFNR